MVISQDTLPLCVKLRSSGILVGNFITKIFFQLFSACLRKTSRTLVSGTWTRERGKYYDIFCLILWIPYKEYLNSFDYNFCRYIIEKLGIQSFSMSEVDRHGIKDVVEKAMHYLDPE